MSRLAVNGSRVLEYIVIGLNRDGNYLEGDISDLLAHPKRLDVADTLIENACDFFEGEGAAAKYYPATKGHPYEELVKRHSFIDASRLKASFFEYKIHISEIDESYIENLPPSRVQLQHF